MVKLLFSFLPNGGKLLHQSSKTYHKVAVLPARILLLFLTCGGHRAIIGQEVQTTHSKFSLWSLRLAHHAPANRRGVKTFLLSAYA